MRRAALFALALAGCADAPVPLDASPRMRFAVIGNSDSHSYRDAIAFPPGSPERGGAQRATTYQWTELLDQLRGRVVDQGTFGVRGRSARAARVASWVGVTLRTPRKYDFAYNVSYSGARCRDVSGPRGQLAQLAATIREEPAAWEGGVVLFRIGINDIGRREVLEEVVRSGYREAQRQLVRDCTATIIDAARTLRGIQPGLRVAIVGILDNLDWPPNFDLPVDSAAIAAVRQMLGDFDAPLRSYAAATPATAFIDDRAWWAKQWGAISPSGERRYQPARVGGLTVTLTQGDSLQHAFVQDGHAGTAFNLLWLQAVVGELDATLGTSIGPITDAEIEALLRDAGGVTRR